ncbi:hypothetical protein Tco_1354439 [Tanacetum coccineum]
MKMYDYGHLEEIEVRRDDQKLYTFKEGDFKRLRLQDIEDMLLLHVQQKLTNLTIDERYDSNVALRMYTRRIVIQRRVEDLQLGVKSYQQKLNLTKIDTIKSNLRQRTVYTAYLNPKGVIYKDQMNKNSVMARLMMFGYRQAALSKEVDAESREVRWSKGIQERSQATGKDNMTLSYFVSTHFRRCGEKDGRGGSMSMISGVGGGWFAIHSIVGKGDGLVVLGVGAGGSEVSGGGVVFRVVSSSDREKVCGGKGFVDGDSIGIDGGATL